MYPYREENKTNLGHICNGVGATITDSPIHLHIHIHTNSEPFVDKVLRRIYAIFGQRNTAIENASQLNEADLQRRILQRD